MDILRTGNSRSRGAGEGIYSIWGLVPTTLKQRGRLGVRGMS